MDEPVTIPLAFQRLAIEDMRRRVDDFLRALSTRRSVRVFSSEPIPLDVVRAAIHAAGQAPSGAHMQPWTFALVTDPARKSEIRRAAEAEERETYEHRMSDEWRAALAPLGTTSDKPFLDEAPALIVVFRQDWGVRDDGGRRKHYYVQESCGIAVGFLIAALHLAGLATLTHTPSPMGFLAKILGRPEHERPYLLLPVGYPAAGCVVPDLERKPLSEILVEFAPPAELSLQSSDQPR
jgi:iodotyrosine deiodinase